jgi:hypothetical protein
VVAPATAAVTITDAVTSDRKRCTKRPALSRKDVPTPVMVRALMIRVAIELCTGNRGHNTARAVFVVRLCGNRALHVLALTRWGGQGIGARINSNRM